jgi:4-oxalmesaconate hydratase
MQVILSDLFTIPEAEVHHPAWRRRRAVSLGAASAALQLNNGKPGRDEIMGNIYLFDTCVYRHQPGIDLLTSVVPVDNILFAHEMVGAVKGNGSQDRLQLTTPSATSTRQSCRMPTSKRSSKATRCGSIRA